MLPIALSAPTFRLADGALDLISTERYAQLVRSTWIKTVIICGPVGLGEDLTPDDRADLAAVWRNNADQLDLVLACWHPDDFRTALAYSHRPLAMLRAATADELVQLVAALPPDTIAYANPRYSQALITPATLVMCADAGHSPTGVKLSKVPLDHIREVRRGSAEMEIWHGSSRHIVASLDAGADLVVSAPLAALPSPVLADSLTAAQVAIAEVQAVLDLEPHHHARVRTITELARRAITLYRP